MGGTVKPEDIEALIELFQNSDWKEFHLRFGDLELFLSKDPAGRAQPHAAAPDCAPRQPAPPPAAPADSEEEAGRAGNATANFEIPQNWVAVTAPNLGTFYRAPKPGAPPYVELGQSVDEDTELCLIEIMKLFTALRAGTKGVVRRICARDGELVEYGQVLFYVETA